MAITGSQKFAILLSRFSDDPNADQLPSSDHFRTMLSRGRGGLNDYWIDASLGSINLDGSEIFEWKDLDINRLDYIAARPSRWDKIVGAIMAHGINAQEFVGVIAVFATDAGDGGAAGAGILAAIGDANPTFLAHETGHLFGIGHSFDQSDRQLMTWSAPGEYYDDFDIMSAMNVRSFAHPAFGQCGPLLNVANLDYMSWLPPDRVWTPRPQNNSYSETIDIVSLSNAHLPGPLAARIGSHYFEFRTNEKWDSGIGQNCVLIHELVSSNSIIIASDATHFVNTWQAGQVFGPGDIELALSGGYRISIESFDNTAKTARIHVQRRAKRPYAAGPGILGVGVDRGAGGFIILPSGRRVPVGPRSPLLPMLEKLAGVAEWALTFEQHRE